jgi:SAM-dependent methyltransferase
MEYNHDLWNEYTTENEDIFQKELGDLIYHISLTLGATRILELGCNAGNNLRSFPIDYDVNGLDMNKVALEKAKKIHKNFNFYEGSLLDVPFDNSEFDLVFTRGVLIHINQSDMDLAVKEMFRVSKKWIFNLEYFGEDGKEIDWKRGKDLLWYRDMNKWWSKYDAEIVTEIDLPQNIDIGKTRLTLIKKK